MFALTGQRKLGKKATHRRLMVKSQMRALFTTGYLVTTTAKAKVLKANAESMITSYIGKTKELVTVRELKEYFGDENLSKHVSEYIESKKGTVLMVKVGYRAGDNAEQTKVVLNGYKTLAGIEADAKKANKKTSKKASKVKKNDDKTDTPDAPEQKSSIESKGKKDNLAKRMANKFSGSQGRSKARSGLEG